MLTGLIIGIIFGVLVLGILAPFVIRRVIQAKKRKRTQIYLLPPPVQTRSMTWPSGWHRIEPEAEPASVIYEPMLPRPRALSDSAPVTDDYITSQKPSVLSVATRLRSFSDLVPMPAEFVPKNAAPTSPRDSIEITPQTATYTLSPMEDLTPRTNGEDVGLSLAHVAARMPAMVRARTFESEAALSNYAGSAASDPASALLPPKTPERANTFHSISSALGSLRSASEYATVETPVVRTAIMYDLSSENLPSWNRASTMHIDEGLPPIPGTSLVPTAYVPYRPPLR